jgi:hypothetical protein
MKGGRRKDDDGFVFFSDISHTHNKRRLLNDYRLQRKKCYYSSDETLLIVLEDDLDVDIGINKYHIYFNDDRHFNSYGGDER